MTGAALLKQVDKELARRRRNQGDGTPVWSLEHYAGGHAPQLAAMQDRSNWLHFLCDRQSGKTWADLGILLDNALSSANSVNVFLGLVGTGLELSVWPKWKLLLERYGVDAAPNETTRITYFPNGAMVAFGGVDDRKNIKKYLGNRLDNAVFIVDEAQDQASSELHYLFEQLLPPMMTPTTRVIMSGVLPDMPVGYFLDRAEYDEASKTGGKGAKWSHHSWGRLDNVHTPEAAQMLAQLEAEKGAADPQLMRDWKRVQRVWDSHATCYRYDTARDQWDGVLMPALAPDMLPPGRLMAVQPIVRIKDASALLGFRTVVLDSFVIGLDPAATADRYALVMWGWSSKERVGLWQLAEWVTARGANALESQWVAVIVALKQAYAPWGHVLKVIRDSAGGTGTSDLLLRNHHLLIEPVIKGPGSKKARVDRLADVLGLGEGHILAGSELEADLRLTKWSLKAREEMRYEFDSAHHPDVADAGTYGATAYYESGSKALTGEEAERQVYLDQVRRAEEEQRRLQAARTGQDATEFQQDFDDLSL